MSPVKKLDVLVVDDDQDNAESLAMLVTLWGHDARISRDGKAALAAVQTRCPDVVLFDLGMPGMSGLELASRLRDGCPSYRPVLVAVTGYGGQRVQMEALKAGAHMGFTKPVAPDELRALLERIQVGLMTASQGPCRT